MLLYKNLIMLLLLSTFIHFLLFYFVFNSCDNDINFSLGLTPHTYLLVYKSVEFYDNILKVMDTNYVINT